MYVSLVKILKYFSHLVSLVQSSCVTSSSLAPTNLAPTNLASTSPGTAYTCSPIYSVCYVVFIGKKHHYTPLIRNMVYFLPNKIIVLSSSRL